MSKNGISLKTGYPKVQFTGTKLSLFHVKWSSLVSKNWCLVPSNFPGDQKLHLARFRTFTWCLWHLFVMILQRTFFELFAAIDGAWSAWSNFSECTLNISNNIWIKTRYRECNNPPPQNDGNNCSSSEPSQNTAVCPSGENSRAALERKYSSIFFFTRVQLHPTHSRLTICSTI